MRSDKWLAVVALLWVLTTSAFGQGEAKLLFYAPFDDNPTAFKSTGPAASTVAASDVLLTSLFGERFADGRVGRGFMARTGGLSYSTDDAFVPERGTLSLWIRPEYDGRDDNLYSTMFGVQNWGLLYKYTNQDFITFGVIKDDGHYDYGCTASIAHWKKGEWHHVAITWDKPAGLRIIYLDGQRAKEGKIPSYRECDESMTIGANWSNANPARGVIDELWIWDRPLEDGDIAAAYERAKAGEPSWGPPAAALKKAGGPQLPTGDRPPLPKQIDWQLHEPAIIRTATRVRLPLSGYWRFAAIRSPDEPATREQMGFLRVPGTWAGDSDWATVYGPDMKPTRKLPDGTQIRHCMHGWYEREFAAPEELAGKRILLRFDSVRAIAQVWLNGKHVGRAIEYEEGVFDVTETVRIGEANTVDAFVSSLKRDGDAKGIDQDVWLEGVPKGPRLRGVGLMPSVGEGLLRVRVELQDADQRQLRLHIACTGSKGEVKALAAPLVVSPLSGTERGPGGEVAVALAHAPWPDAHLWSPDDPYLYTATVRLEDAEGKLVDELPPFRFGFREFEIRGGDFYLNGNKTHLRGQSSPPFSHANSNTDPLFIRGWFARLKRTGANCVRDYSYGMRTGQRFWAKDNVFDIADEMGVMFFAHLPDLRNVLVAWDRPQVREGYRRRIASYVRRYRNHPCVIMWQQDFNLAAHTGDIAPFILDTDYFPSEASYQRRKQVAQEAEAMLQEIDPSLPVLHHASGNLGQMRTTMTYLGFGVPLQEREEWPRLWSEKKQKPLMIMETGFPCILSYYKTRNFPLHDVYHSEPLVVEYAAMSLGERAYELEGDAEMEYYDPATYGRHTEQIRTGPTYQAQKDLWTTRCLRSWRTYDMSGIILHVEIREAYDYEPQEIAPRPFDARTPYMYVEKLPTSVSRVARTLPMLDALQRANWPVIGYIGGPKENWVSKDHAFFEGERIEKSAIFINDRAYPVKIEGNWHATLDPAAGPMAEGPIDVTVQPGETLFVPLAFEAPDVQWRDDGVIALQANGSDGTTIEDSFGFEVFQRLRHPIIARCVLIPGDGSTRKVLQEMEAGFTEWDGEGEAPDTKLLIIGRRAGVWTQQIEERVASGKTHVVCFEQEGDSFAGFRLDDAWTRDCFVSAPGHSLMQGMSDRDFRNWRGDSDITEAYPNPGLGDPPRYPEEFWHWGNTNCVCTYPIEKPQRPGFTPLLSCEFDLLYTPLLDWRLGAGRVLFCQLDVSNRYDTDPVARMIVHRILDLYDKPGREPEPRARPAAQAPSQISIVGANAEKVREALGLEAQTASTGRGPARATLPLADELDSVLASGGVVVLLADVDPHTTYNWTPPLKEARIAKTNLRPEDRLAFPGLSNSDLFWKRYQDLKVLADLPEGSLSPETGIFGIIPRGKGNVVIMRYDPFAFEDPRQRTKSLRVLSILLNQCGVQGMVASPYAEEALDFNPHRYRRW